MFLFSWYTQNCHVLNSIRRSFRLAAPRVADQNQTEFSLLFSVLFFAVLFVVVQFCLYLSLMVSCSIPVTGWMSIGSLDGILYSISPDGDMRKLFEETALDSAIPVDPVLDCSGFSMYVAKTVVERKLIWTTGEHTSVSVMKPSHILVTLLDPANGTIYWTGEYPGLFLYMFINQF